MAINRLNPDYPDAGIVQLMPSSVVVSGGSGSVNGNGTLSFSGTSSVSLNDVFSSNYVTYKILLEYSASASGTGVNLYLRVGGADSTANYAYQNNTVDGASVGAARFTSLTTGWEVSITGTGSRNMADITITNPFVTGTTTGYSQAPSSFNTVYARNFWFTNTNNTSYTGCSLVIGTGTMTGTVSVYGYRN